MSKRRGAAVAVLLVVLAAAASVTVMAGANLAPTGSSASSMLRGTDGGHDYAIVASPAQRRVQGIPLQLPREGVVQASQTITRSHYVNPGTFNWDSDQTDIVMSTEIGLVWKPDVNEDAGFYMHRPPDWDRETPVQVHIFFALGGSEAGTVNWRLKLNSYAPNSGQWLTNPGDRVADEILVFASGPSWFRIYSQTFTLAPSDFQDESLWEFYFLRGDGENGETFDGNLYVLGAEVEYLAGNPARNVYLPLILR